MTYYVEIPVDDDSTVLVEVTHQVTGVAPAGRPREVVARLSETFGEAFDRFHRLAQSAAARARDAGGADRVAIEFGLKVAAKGGFVVAETTGEAHMKVTFEWNRRAEPTPAEADPQQGGTEERATEPDHTSDPDSSTTAG
ncbi:CU044_2847 family protein [Plantactinospora sp. ZYX-F-223]|uniref:CU044_2847 family protein n=1 Tax=Plantactinospora sp. ZYX-F-223 TaxID=3144103 RepID=UPI0031FDCCD7